MFLTSNMLLGVLLLIFGVCQCFSYGAPTTPHHFPLGAIGCKFTDHLCKTNEACIDDLLFGNCQPLDSLPDTYKYVLDEDSLEILGEYINFLIGGRFSWRDGLTQCVLQNALVAYRNGQRFDPEMCGTVEVPWEEGPTNAEIASQLEKLFQDYYDSYQPSLPSQDLGLSSSKRDEIVQVHKYFDKSPQAHFKRDFNNIGQNYPSYLPVDPRIAYGPYLFGDSKMELRKEDLDWDQRALRDYIQQLRGNNRNYYGSMGYPSSAENFQGSHDINQMPIDQQGTWIDSDVPVQENWVEDGNEYFPELDKSMISPAALGEDDGLPPPYANMLSKLQSGELKPENLTDDDLDFLTAYEIKQLYKMGYSSEELRDAGIIGDEDNFSDDLKGEVKIVPGAEPLVNGQEDKEVFDSRQKEIQEAGQENEGPTDGSLEAEAMKDLGTKRAFQRGEDMRLSSIDRKKDRIDKDFAFIDTDKHLNVEETKKFLDVLESTLGVEPYSFNPVEEYGERLTFYVNPDISNRTAAQIVDAIAEKKSEIESKSNVGIVKFGNMDRIASVGNSDRYFVLTFVLCGCIAGILLAVVVIYLIRRYSRSKEKLAQLSATNDNTEASKDYQDLCRQRMQGKSSEKPEPLHAASRIGSVSESQVRSPSSRSSTSSWSEEPVTSNMDISTGHIVLSYMEDHLKNKDRLEREWENLCSYEADPANTNVASDSSNMRKNRYTDILPYDHSRVVLSNTSNVSGSDYINASSITDHDPRNPAYIATQGPLPHTVADFWQMVWEQGSVVIVMLTKLTENGVAMCHRYWPEEGSDLYHIYEVHLVSEHIWCDDYLVRSFYLKNLQTNETRTVTMFHFLTWPDLGVPSSIKSLLDFRRKVNKSYRGRSCPIVVHCSDGCGRTGTYCLVDMVLNRMAKGAKEIDIAATLEHIRDQRMDMVKTKEQFQFSLACVAEEVHAILKALPQ